MGYKSIIDLQIKFKKGDLLYSECSPDSIFKFVSYYIRYGYVNSSKKTKIVHYDNFSDDMIFIFYEILVKARSIETKKYLLISHNYFKKMDNVKVVREAKLGMLLE